MRIELGRMRAWAGRSVFRIHGRFEIFRLAWMPLPPASSGNVVAHVTVCECHRRPGTPRAAQPHVMNSGRSGQPAVIEDERAVFARVMFALSRNVSALVRRAVNLAVLKPSLAIAENEVDVAFDVAILEVLARNRARLAVAGAAPFAADVQSVLVAEQAHVLEFRTVGRD